MSHFSGSTDSLQFSLPDAKLALVQVTVELSFYPTFVSDLIKCISNNISDILTMSPHTVLPCLTPSFCLLITEADLTQELKEPWFKKMSGSRI